MRKLYASRLVSVATASIVATLGVVALTFAATTISTNINTGGTLTVSGASTLTGSLSTAGSLYASSTLNITATSTFTGDALFSKGVGIGADNSVAKTILISGLSTAPDSSEGRLYYNSGSKALQLYDGTQWANVATSTGGAGLDVSGSRLQLNSLNSYLTIGTTTQQGLSMLTLEATSTAGIPLSIVGYNGQTANLLQFRNSSSVNLFYINSSGGLVSTASSTVVGAFNVSGPVNASSTLLVNGLSTLTGGYVSGASSTVVGPLTVTGNVNASSTLVVDGNVTLGNAAGDAIVLTGNASTTNGLTVGGNFIASASSTVSGNFNASGKINAGATSTPVAELGAIGTATTTLYMHTSASLTGSCIQMVASNGSVYRMWIGAADTSTTTTSGHNGLVAIWEAGSCK